MPARRAPMIVPQRAIATVNPSEAGVRGNKLVSDLVAPAITAVSNPNKRPPSPATAVLLTRGQFRVAFRRCSARFATEIMILLSGGAKGGRHDFERKVRALYCHGGYRLKIM